jgi:hypothetical protein
MPGPVVLGLVLAGPPLLCGCWYLLWRRWYPDAARASQLRRSRAARQALHALQSASSRTGPALGDCVAGAVAGYLRERFDRTPAELTPIEARELLLAHGCPAELAEKVEVVLRGCAAVRFPPVPAEEADLVEQAGAFITSVEELT